MSKLTETFKRLGSCPERIMSFAEREAGKLIFLIIAMYTVIFSGYAIFMHYAFKTYAWDLGIFTQSLWTTVNLGRPFHYSIEMHVNPSQNFFGAHFAPILVLVVPIYALCQSPMTLLVLQSLVLGLAALPTYLLARDKLHSKLWGLTFATAFLLHPALHGMNCFDFHVEAFTPLFFLLTFYYIERKQWKKGCTFALLTLSTIEFAPILILFLAFYFIIKAGFQAPRTNTISTLKRMSFPIILIAVSISWFFGAFQVMYSVNPLKATGLPGNWDIWGSSMSQVIQNVLRNPLIALGTVANPMEKIYYAFSIFMPVIFLPFAAPFELLLVAPWLLAALLSEYPPYYEPYFQYFGFIAAQIFIAAIYGVKNLVKLTNPPQQVRSLTSVERRLMALIICLSLLSSLVLSPIGLPALTRRRVELNRHVGILHEVLSLVPANASVATQNDILPHLAQRENISILGWPRQSTVDFLDVDFVVVDIKSSHFLYGPYPTFIPPDEALSYLINSTKYGIMAYADGVVLLKKGYTGERILKPYQESFNYEDFWRDPTKSYIGFDQSSQSGRIIVYDTHHSNGTVWYGPYVYLYEGKYNATFRIKIRSENASLVIDVNGAPPRSLNSSDFEALDKWQEFSITFEIDDLQRMEYRGRTLSNNTYIALDYVRVTQIEP